MREYHSHDPLCFPLPLVVKEPVLQLCVVLGVVIQVDATNVLHDHLGFAFLTPIVHEQLALLAVWHELYELCDRSIVQDWQRACAGIMDQFNGETHTTYTSYL